MRYLSLWNLYKREDKLKGEDIEDDEEDFVLFHMEDDNLETDPKFKKIISGIKEKIWVMIQVLNPS